MGMLRRALMAVTAFHAAKRVRCFTFPQLLLSPALRCRSTVRLRAQHDGDGEHFASLTPFAVGSVVRLKDSGELGRIEEKKGGGWWRVSLDDGVVSTRRLNLVPMGNPLVGSEKPPVQLTSPKASPAGRPSLSELRANSRPPLRSFSAKPLAETAEAPKPQNGADVKRKRKLNGSSAAAIAVPGSPIAAGPSEENAGMLAAEALPQVEIRALGDREGLPHAACKQWVVFSDLHVSAASLSVCLQVLDAVHDEASKREACGIAFLGDFWQVRGSIRVELLNAVMERLSSWKWPVVMIPGNHDQVTLGGAVHSLSPLRFAFADASQAVIISEPTLFLGALWLPHERDPRRMRAALAQAAALKPRAIFCHADVRGATTNGGLGSRAPLEAGAFPRGVPVYSGHYHRPHVVGASETPLENGDVAADGSDESLFGVRYVGSPYQTSLAEAGQQKALLVLGASAWREIDLVPLSLGRRHFRLLGEEAAPAAPGPAEAQRGDRVVWSVPDVRAQAVAAAAEALRERGLEVELRELPRRLQLAPAAAPSTSGAATDTLTLTPAALFSQYLEWDAARNVSCPENISRAGFGLIDELLGLGDEQTSASAASNGAESEPSGGAAVAAAAGEVRVADATRLRSERQTDLRLHSVRLQNFGPFREEVEYPLDDRGVVLLRGMNLDDSGADSNGAGKTTLAVAPLWALTGNFDVRPVSDGRVSDVVFDSGVNGNGSSASVSPAEEHGAKGVKRSSGVAEVTLTGMLNGKPLTVTRRKGARLTQLSVEHGGRDLTRQTARDTQAVLEEELGLSPAVLGRAVFQGQHALNGLLESTDARLKEGLALLVPMDLWTEAASLCRRRAGAAALAATAAGERRTLREGDAARLQDQIGEARAAIAARRAAQFSHVTSSSQHDSEATAGSAFWGEDESDGQLVGPPATAAASAQTPLAAEVAMARARQHSEEARKDLAVAEAEATKLRREAAAALHEVRTQAKAKASKATVAAERALFGKRDANAAEAAAASAAKAAKAARSSLQAALDSCKLDVLLPPWGPALSDASTGGSWRDGLTQERSSRFGAPSYVAEQRSGGMFGPNGSFEDYRSEDHSHGARQLESKPSSPPSQLAPPVWWVNGAKELERRLEEASAALEAARSAAADADAASRQAAAHIKEHSTLAARGAGECHTCGQGVTGPYLRDRGVHLQAAHDEASARRRGATKVLESAAAAAAAARSAAERWEHCGTLDIAAASAMQIAAQASASAASADAAAAQAEAAAATAKGEAERAAASEADEAAAWESRMQALEAVVRLNRDKQTLAQRSLADAVEALSRLRLEHQSAAEERSSLDKALGAARKVLEERRADAERVDSDLQALRREEAAANERKATYAALAEHMGVRGVQNFVFRDAVQQLESNVARYLDVLSDGALRLSLSLEGDRIEKTVFVRGADGRFRQRTLSQLSGGQWRRASIALELAFGELARQRSRFSCNVLVLDEVLSQLDAYGRARVAAVLRGLVDGGDALGDSSEPLPLPLPSGSGEGGHSAAVVEAERSSGGSYTAGRRRNGLYSTVLVVLQDLPADELEDAFDQVDEVTKQGDRSTVRVDRSAADD